MIASLPLRVFETVERELAGFSIPDLRQAAERISLAYRGNAPIRASLSAIDRAAYLAVRFPSTFAAANRVWQEIAHLIPLEAIASILDAGAGPGTASLAAHAHVQSGTRFTRLERDQGWRDIADRMAASCGIEGKFHHGVIARAMQFGEHDGVIACYALGELPPAERAASIAGLWSAAAKMLVVIEPGTPAGFENVLQVRQHCLTAGGHALAPCTHDAHCPMSRADWCHRPVRVERSDVHRAAKGAELGYEDEKFSYIVMTRETPPRHASARIVRKPMRNTGHLHLDVCEAGELKRLTITRSDGAIYRRARDAAWGDPWPPQGE